MQKRLVAAIGLSLFILIIWSVLFPAPKTQPIVKQQVIDDKAGIPPSVIASPELAETTAFIYKTDLMELTFSLPSGTIKNVYFKKFHYSPKNLALIGQLSNSDGVIEFSDYKISENKVTFYSLKHKINKSFIIHKSSYIIELDIDNVNILDQSDYWLDLGQIDLLKNPRKVKSLEFVIFSNGKPQKFPLYQLKTQVKEFNTDIKIIGIHGTHFCYLLKNNKLEKYRIQVTPMGNDRVRFSQSVASNSYSLFLGPQDKDLLKEFDVSAAENLAHFNAIAKFLLSILSFLHLIVRNWGLAIVLLSLLIYGMLYPLTHKQMQSMKEMQALQPHIENLRKIYKDNPQRLNKEILELYKEHKVNPLGGCLPLVLQIPVFFALYQALSKSLLLKGAKFLWIKDLTEPDKLFVLRGTFPVIGNEVNLLPILMALTMFGQQKLSLKSASPGQREQQKMMMVIFPIMFGFIFYSFPSGLVIYWFINSLLTLVYQWKVSK